MKIGRIEIPMGGSTNVIIENFEFDFKEIEDLTGTVKELFDRLTAAKGVCHYTDVCTDANTEKCKKCAHRPVRSHFVEEVRVVKAVSKGGE